MADKILGPLGRALFWVAYLFLFMTVMIAHAVGGGDVLNDITGLNLPHWLSVVLYTGVIAPIVYLSSRSVERISMFFISGVIFCYLAFIFISSGHIKLSYLSHENWGKAWFALPILFTAFTYQVIIPTLMTYMNRDVRKVRMAIILGSSIPLLIYLIWEFLILGESCRLQGLSKLQLLGKMRSVR